MECLECGSRFNDNLKKNPKKNYIKENGLNINITHVGAPKNPFESAAINSQKL